MGFCATKIYEEMIRVPYIWKVPDSFETKHSNEKEKNNEDVVSLLDFVPTVLDYANISQDVMDLRQEGKAEKIGLPGRSLKKYLSNKEKLEAKPAIIEYDEDWHKGPFYRERVIVYKNYKLVVFPIAGGKMLFDLENDPHETINLYDDKDYRDIKEELMEKLLFELVRTDRMDQARICGA